MTSGHARDLNGERLELVLEATGLDLWENDLRTGEVTRAARKTFVELGYAESEVPGLVARQLSLVHPDDRGPLLASLQEVLAGRVRAYRCEFRLLTRTDEWLWYANHGRLLDDADGGPGTRLVGVTYNIDERKRREQELAAANRRLEEQNQLLQELNLRLQRLASTDSLTGLLNRRCLLERGEAACQQAACEGRPLALLMVDIDHFKAVNDRWGHQLGDRVIRAAADACRRVSRAGRDIVARLGGEEFVLVLPDTGEEGARTLAERLRQEAAAARAQQQEPGDGAGVGFTVSIGVALHQAGMGIDALLHQADQRLYQAKQLGRDRVCGCEAPTAPLATPA